MTQFQCPVCYDDFSLNEMVIICWNEHKLCDTCYKGCCDSERSLKCPLDRTQMFDFRITISPPQRLFPRWKIYRPTDFNVQGWRYQQDDSDITIYFYNGRHHGISHYDLFTTRILNSGLDDECLQDERQWRFDNLQDYLFLNHRLSPYNDRSRNCSLCGCMGHMKSGCEKLWRGFFTDDEAQIRRWGAMWSEFQCYWGDPYPTIQDNVHQNRVEKLLTCLTPLERDHAEVFNAE